MEFQQLDILIRLLLAHLLADFIFQTKWIVEGKRNGLKSKHIYIHLIIVGILTYVLLGEWANWKIPLVLMLLHGLIDITKIKLYKDNLFTFIIDQALHIISIVSIWFYYTNNSIIDIAWRINLSTNALIICTSYLLVSLPTAILVNYITKEWNKEIDVSQNESLTNAGRWIGIIERILILTFILLQQWTPIGFLLAAKSIFRFGDLKDGNDNKRTEYILIGTLLSFTFAILTGILTVILLTKK